MALSGKVSIDVEIATHADKFFEGLVSANEIYPKIFPEKFEAIEILEGDGKSVDSVRKIIFSDDIPHIKTVVEKLVVLDHGSKTITYKLIDGDLKKYFHVFVAETQVVASGSGSIVKFSLEYEKVNEEPPSPHVFLEKAKKGFEDFSAHLLSH